MSDSVLFSKAMADETRQEIMHLLCCQWLCVNDVAGQLDVTQPTVSHHLAILREAGLVNWRRDGKQIFYTLNQQEVAVCCGMLMQRFAPEERVELHLVESPTEVESPTGVQSPTEVKEQPATNRPTARSSKSWQVWD